MNFTTEQQTALQALIKNFKCPVCGNTHINFIEDVLFNPLFDVEGSDKPVKWQQVARGHCGWCGLVLEFDMDKVMASYALMTKK